MTEQQPAGGESEQGIEWLFTEHPEIAKSVRSAVNSLIKEASETRPESHAATSRVNVSFTPRARASLERLAGDQGKTISETLRDALRLAQFAHDLQKEGGKLLVERDGKVQELLLM